MKKLGLLLLVVLMCVMTISVASAAIVAVSINVSNYNVSGMTLDIHLAGENATGGDIRFVGNGNTSPPYVFQSDSNTLLPLGPVDIDKVLAMTNTSNQFTNQVPIFSPADAYIGFVTEEGYYGVLTIDDVITQGQLIVNFTVDYKYNNQVGNLSLDNGSITGYCVDQPDQQACFGAGAGCFWLFALGQCMEETFEEGHFDDSNPSCFIFDGQEEWCEKVNFCSYSGGFCDPTGGGEPAIGCGNITNSTLCSSIPMLGSCCEWTGTACTTTQNNSCYDANTLPNGQTFCEDWNVTTQAVCDTLAAFPYFLPCAWDNVTNNCGFGFGDFFAEGPGGFDELGTQQTCEAAGGNWKSEVYQFTNLDGSTSTETHEWCEMQFGFGSESCDTSCWACEFQPDGTSWADATAAQSACGNSSLGYCQFNADSNAFNGYGWCDFPREFTNGAGDCDSDCGSCNFMNDPQTACEGSDKGCNWVTLNTSLGEESWCESNKKLSCISNCFQCFDEVSCTNSPKTCEWDTTFYFCKPEGFGGQEVCFDGIDNDGDNNVDCADSDCGFDQFCGGASFGQLIDCPQYDAENGGNISVCSGTTTPFGNCTWVNTSATGFEGLCENPGEVCFYFAESNTSCIGQTGCTWVDKTGCGINLTAEHLCANFDGTDQATCRAQAGCQWYNSSGEELCDSAMLESCPQYTTANTCMADGNCTWIQDEFGPNGFCDAICFGQEYRTNQTACTSNPACQWQSGFCEGDFFGGNCFQNDGNQTACQAEGNGNLCTYIIDPGAANSVGGSEPDGWCNDKNTAQLFQGQEGGEPIILATDGPDSGVHPSIDLMGLGLKDNKNSYAFGAPVSDKSGAAFCDAGNTTKFFLFMDTDGLSTNNCNSTDNSYQGFEFYFTYKSQYDSNDMEVDETRLAYRCLNQSGTYGWVPTPIPISSWEKVMCNDINGPMLAIEKESLRKFNKLYNESQDIRVYMISANESTNKSSPLDSVGPAYYTPGTADFKFECCNCPGQDVDGDGFTSEQDPDCKKFNQLGYVPFEGGPQCADNVDNDGNGFTDCADPNCVYDPFFCGGNFDAQANDTKTPKLVWHQVNRFPDFAIIKFDTNEPANGTLLFYNQTVACSGSPVATLYDVGLSDSFSGNEFKPWHDVPLDQDQLGYALQSNTTYRYKIKYCDPSRNCGLSACLNFTTRTSVSNFVIAFDLPENFTVSIPQLNINNDNFTYGKQTNATVAKNLNVTFTCDASGYAITLIGMNLLEASDINFTNAFTCGALNTTDDLLGMNTSKWQDILQDTGVDYIKLFLPTNATGIDHCDDSGGNCQDVNSSVSCTYSNNQTECLVPVSTGLGFSTYRLTGVLTGAAQNNNNNNNGGGGGGGGGSSGSSSSSSSSGGGAAVASTTSTRTVNIGQISAGDTVSFNPNSVGIPVSLAQLKVKNSLAIMSVKFTAHNSKPDNVPAYENAYQYLDMNLVYGSNEDIDGFVTVTFKVPKSWVDENSTGPESVKLYKLIGGVWSELATTHDGESGDDYTFKTTMRGFSQFVIAAQPKPVVEESVIVDDVPEITGNAIEEPVIEQPQPTQDTTEVVADGLAHSTGLGTTVALYALFIVVVVGSLGMLVYQKYPHLLQQIKVKDKKSDPDTSKETKSAPKVEPTANVDKNHPHLKELRKYIKEAKKEGYSVAEITEILDQAGWPKEIYEKELK